MKPLFMWEIHPKLKNNPKFLLPFTHLYVIPNLYAFFCGTKIYIKKCLSVFFIHALKISKVHLLFWTPLTFIVRTKTVETYFTLSSAWTNDDRYLIFGWTIVLSLDCSTINLAIHTYLFLFSSGQKRKDICRREKVNREKSVAWAQSHENQQHILFLYFMCYTQKLTLACIHYARVWRAYNTQFLRAYDMHFVGIHMICTPKSSFEYK